MKALRAVVHPFGHVAVKGTFYDHRQRSFSCRPQNFFIEDDNRFNHKTDSIKLYNESMYRLGVFAPQPGKAAKELPK